MQTQSFTPARVVPYDPRHRAAFVALNEAWIEKYFRIEPMDRAQLDEAEARILAVGGEIFFVVEGEGGAERAVGTCAVVPHGEVFEIAKMAVEPDRRGLGYGDRLMEAAIAWARARDVPRLTILSNTVLEPAIALYRKHGFQVLSLGPHPDYARCDIEMELRLES